MVKDIECFSAELKVDFFSQLELPPQRSIDLPCPETTNHIAPQVSKLPGGRNREGCSIDLSATWQRWIKDIQRRSGDEICPSCHNRTIRWIKHLVTSNINRSGRLGVHASVHRPSAQKGI